MNCALPLKQQREKREMGDIVRTSNGLVVLWAASRVLGGGATHMVQAFAPSRPLMRQRPNSLHILADPEHIISRTNPKNHMYVLRKDRITTITRHDKTSLNLWGDNMFPFSLLRPVSTVEEMEKKIKMENWRNSYGEQKRTKQRTVYDRDAWVKHRSNDRIFRNLRTTFNSGVLRQLGTEVFLVIAVAVGVVFWNSVFATGFVDLNGVQLSPLLTEIFGIARPDRFLFRLPEFIFLLSLPALSLLLGKCALPAYEKV
jgi:hypothetical protein